MKHCNKCDTSKSAIDFGLNKTTNDGLQTQCKSCRRTTNNEHYRNSVNRRDTIKRNRARNTKINKTLVRRLKRAGCSKCEENDPCTLDFHHVNPASKDKEVARLVIGGIHKLKAEIRKCIIVCANCHRKIHNKSR